MNADAPRLDTQKEAFLARLERVAAHTLALDVPSAERSPDALLGALHTRTAALTRAAQDLLGDVIDHCDARSATAFGGPLADLAFVGRLTLKSVQRQLSEANADSHFEMLTACNVSRREILRALAAVDDVLSRDLGRTRARSFLDEELTSSIEVRHAFYLFHAEVPAPGARGELLSRVLRAVTAITKLTARPCYPHVRIQDRTRISELQRRLGVWIETVSEQRSVSEDGEELVREAHALARVLLGVNFRPELMMFDRARFTEALSLLDEVDDGLERAMRQLSDCGSRDAEIDEVLQGRGTPDAASLRARLTAALARLDQTPRRSRPLAAV